MSVNVFFTQSVRELEGFTSIPLANNSGEEMSFKGMTILGSNGILYTIVNEEWVVPAELVEHVERISLFTSISMERARRETGIYRRESASAEVVVEYNGKQPSYKIKVVGKKPEDVRGLLHLIKTGGIRPVESYEGPQMGKSRARLEAELEAATIRIQNLGRELDLERGNIATVRRICDRYGNALSDYLNALRQQRWPLCRRRRVMAEVEAILIDR